MTILLVTSAGLFIIRAGNQIEGRYTQESLARLTGVDCHGGEYSGEIRAGVDAYAPGAKAWPPLGRRVAMYDGERQAMRTLQEPAANGQEFQAILLLQRHIRLDARMDEQIVARDMHQWHLGEKSHMGRVDQLPRPIELGLLAAAAVGSQAFASRPFSTID